jgi:hypothetical protein
LGVPDFQRVSTALRGCARNNVEVIERGDDLRCWATGERGALAERFKFGMSGGAREIQITAAHVGARLAAIDAAAEDMFHVINALAVTNVSFNERYPCLSGWVP